MRPTRYRSHQFSSRLPTSSRPVRQAHEGKRFSLPAVPSAPCIPCGVPEGAMTVPRPLVARAGGVTPALLLQYLQVLAWDAHYERPHHTWFRLDPVATAQATSLSKRETGCARRALLAAGLIEERVSSDGAIELRAVHDPAPLTVPGVDEMDFDPDEPSFHLMIWRSLATLAGSIDGALLLGYAIEASTESSLDDPENPGWFVLDYEHIEVAVCLPRLAVDAARRDLRATRFLQEWGLPQPRMLLLRADPEAVREACERLRPRPALAVLTAF